MKPSAYEKEWKRKMGKQTTAANVWDELETAREPYKTSLRPAGGFTMSEYAAKFGLKIGSAHREIQKLIEAGKVQRHGSKPCYYSLCQPTHGSSRR